MKDTDVAALSNRRTKRTKLSVDGDAMLVESSSDQLPSGQCLYHLISPALRNGTHSIKAPPLLPPTLLSSGKIRNNISKLKSLFDDHGFRTSVVSSPREALSIYKDSCTVNDNDDETTNNNVGGAFLVSMLGLHPDQNAVERCYAASARDIYCLVLFCQKIRTSCSKAMEDARVMEMISKYEDECHSLVSVANDSHGHDIYVASTSPEGVASSSPSLHGLPSTVSERVSSLMTAIARADHNIRRDQLQREYDRIKSLNSTYANALLQIFLDSHECSIKDIYFKGSHAPKYERLTIYLYDPQLDEIKPQRFTFLPCLRRVIDDGPEAVAMDMVSSFWCRLLRHGYFATSALKEAMTPDIRKYFVSGITNDPTLPLLLNAHFNPSYPLSFYLHGKAGSGKSSLVRYFSPVLNGTVEEYCDPDILVRFVKQNLNKPLENLSLELELRPNNNDLSVMSIIQGRRMTLTQSKPGLVVVGLEELASDEETADPNQVETCKLISQRFSGRTSDFREGEGSEKPRNSTKRGISGDATLIALLTSNYELGRAGCEALKRLDMFSNLTVIEVAAVSGEDRVEFANTYIAQCIRDHFNPNCEVELNIPVGSGDTRPLVRHLRMLSSFVCSLISDKIAVGPSVCATITHNAETNLTTVMASDKSIHLREGAMDNLYPIVPYLYDSRAESSVAELRKLSEVIPITITEKRLAELTQILDFYYTKTLAPAVVIANDASLIQTVVAAIATQDGVHSIVDVDPNAYKMMKSLYDPVDTPNLRDDVLKFGKGAYVAVEIKCKSRDDQLLIREIVEDTPSMTAFSSNKSALYKDGLFFGVYVEGDVTPELRSRASLIL